MDDERHNQGGDSPTTQRRSPESTLAPRRRPPVARLGTPASREAVCELLGVAPRTVQRRVHAGDIERMEGDERPLYILSDTPWTRGQLARARWGLSPGGDIMDIVVASSLDNMTPPSVAPSTVAHEDLAKRLNELAESVSVVDDLATRIEELENHADLNTFTRQNNPSGAASSDVGKPEVGDHDHDQGAPEADPLTGWRAVCMAVLVRLKLLLDAIMNAVRGERG